MTARLTNAPRQAFVDTHALFAIIERSDLHHDDANRWFLRLATRRTALFTTDWVLAEFLSLASRPALRAPALAVVRDLQASGLTTILEATRRDWELAFDLFANRSDKAWSFVDCVSINSCRRLRIKHVLTHDHHFTQAGFEILL